jgi:flavodoxin
MKILVTYSTLTGNTKKVAEAILKVMPEGTDIFPIEEAPAPEQYDLICLGFWANRENADNKAQNYMNQIKNKKVALFATLGAYPDSEHALKTMENAKANLHEENDVVGTYMCQGKVDEKLIKRFAELPADHPHGMTPERKARIEEASKHPNSEDFKKAQEIFGDVLAKL